MQVADVAVVIPTFNRINVLRRAIDSVLNQSVWCAEIIVVDDGSDDGTGRYLNTLTANDSPVRCVAQEHAGPAAARNLGARKATSNVLIFLDSDDELEPCAIESFGRAFSSSNVAVVCAPAREVYSDGSFNRQVGTRQLGPAYEDAIGLFLAGSFAVLRTAFVEVGEFSTACRSSQHTELSLRLIPYCRERGLEVAVLDEPTVRIHMHDGCHLRGSIQTLYEGAQYIVTNHERQLRKSPKHYTDWCTVAAVYAAKLHRFGDARRLLRMAIAAQPFRVKNHLRYLVASCPPLAGRCWQSEL